MLSKHFIYEVTLRKPIHICFISARLYEKTRREKNYTYVSYMSRRPLINSFKNYVETPRFFIERRLCL